MKRAPDKRRLAKAGRNIEHASRQLDELNREMMRLPVEERQEYYLRLSELVEKR